MFKQPWFRPLMATGLVFAALPAVGQVQELFSRHLRVFRPQGSFPHRLIKLQPPAGERWKALPEERLGFRISVPAVSKVDETPSGSRILEVVLAETQSRPRPVLRVDSFKPQPGDPTVVDADYTTAYAEQLPESLNGKLQVLDSGHVVLRKRTNLAMAGGTYPLGAVVGYRLQWVHLAEDRQLFFTFDCPEHEWEDYAARVGQILLSLEIPGSGERR